MVNALAKEKNILIHRIFGHPFFFSLEKYLSHFVWKLPIDILVRCLSTSKIKEKFISYGGKEISNTIPACSL